MKNERYDIDAILTNFYDDRSFNFIVWQIQNKAVVILVKSFSAIKKIFNFNCYYNIKLMEIMSRGGRSKQY